MEIRFTQDEIETLLGSLGRDERVCLKEIKESKARGEIEETEYYCKRYIDAVMLQAKIINVI